MKRRVGRIDRTALLLFGLAVLILAALFLTGSTELIAATLILIAFSCSSPAAGEYGRFAPHLFSRPLPGLIALYHDAHSGVRKPLTLDQVSVEEETLQIRIRQNWIEEALKLPAVKEAAEGRVDVTKLR